MLSHTAGFKKKLYYTAILSIKLNILMKSDRDLLHLIDYEQIHLKLHVQYLLFYLPASIIVVDFRMRKYYF